MSGAPRVSVILAVHNAADTVAAAVRSVLWQSWSDLELVIVDDGSDDGTGEVLTRLAEGDGRVRLLNNPKRLERGHARNRALRDARGEFVAIMDADDVSLPARMERQVRFLDRNPNVGVLGGWGYEVHPDGAIISLLTPPTRDADIRSRMRRCNPFIHSSVMYRREIALRAGSYDTRLNASEDQDLEWRLLMEAEGAILPEVVVLRRLDWKREKRLGRFQRARSLRIRYKWVRRNHATPADYACFALAAARLALPGAVDVWLRRLKRRLRRPSLTAEATEWFRRCSQADAPGEAFPRGRVDDRVRSRPRVRAS